MTIKEKNVTIKDIASELNISVNAVSKALRDCRDISEQTKQRVRKAADQMGYIPNNLALSLKRGRTNNIAVIFNDFYNPYFSILCDKVFREIHHRDFQASLIFCDTHLLGIKDTERLMVNKFCGIISFVEPTEEVASFFAKRNIPFTLIGIRVTHPSVHCIYTDDIAGGKLVGDFFVKSEYQKALYLTNSFSETSYRRFSGFSETIQKSEKMYDIIPYQLEDDVIKKAYAKIKNEKFDFIFCFSDSLGIELLNYLEKNHFKRSLLIFGYDHLYKYYRIIPSILSVDSDMDAIIAYACDLTIQLVNHNGSGHSATHKIFPVRLALENS